MTDVGNARMPVSKTMLDVVNAVVEADLVYERLTSCGRKFGNTGEVGEILVCHQMNLDLIRNPRSEGYDAVDKDGLLVQIKSRRGESTDLPKNSGPLSRFSDHRFGYALLAILTQDYRLHEIWRADHKTLKPIIERRKRSNPTTSQFKTAGHMVCPQ